MKKLLVLASLLAATSTAYSEEPSIGVQIACSSFEGMADKIIRMRMDGAKREDVEAVYTRSSPSNPTDLFFRDASLEIIRSAFKGDVPDRDALYTIRKETSLAFSKGWRAVCEYRFENMTYDKSIFKIKDGNGNTIEP
ncbi:hypothetical protein FHV99_004632 [Ochrobactrum sp. P20RRXII]|nr:hypothetical protein [Ochrobactrum sp. P20RRXII]NIH77380.1 hypothetical protein [Ochrobactrum sp. P20RRXII]